jgi:uncharacterized membrane protein
MELSAVAVAVANKGMVALISCIGYLNNNFFIFTLFLTGIYSGIYTPLITAISCDIQLDRRL